MDITFRVIQYGNDLNSGQVVKYQRTVADFPGTPTGARKALATAKAARYGQVNQIAPTGRGVVFACANGNPVIVKATGTPFELTKFDLEPDRAISTMRTKSACFASLLRAIKQHID